MENKVLVIVHVEPDFGSSAEDLVPFILRHIENNNYRRIINITSADALTGTEPFLEMAGIGDDLEWIWGGEPDCIPEDGKEFDNFILAGGHEYAEILDWMRELPKDCNYDICGGGRYECLKDITDIWSHLNLEYSVIENLTY
ncbi:hypothetical protein [Tenacibaculum sp.]|uniref:hypothetical protein n=1 Tax=Tenacibaculum sp. TaxID=1906242 RepID=UPI003D0B3B24